MGGELVERADQLAALRESFLRVRTRGEGCLVLVAGEAGAGKSALLRSFREKCGDQARFLWGYCDAVSPPRPLGPLADFTIGVDGPFALAVERMAEPREVLPALISELTKHVPSVAVFEDLHWADEATLDLLRLLGRRVGHAPALVIVTYREDELDRAPTVRATLGDIATSAGIRRVNVPPLSLDGTRRLAADHLIDGDELHRMTGGNPFFVTEALAAGAAEMPRTVRDAVLTRAGRLRPAAREVLEMVAIVPPCAETWLLDALGGAEPEPISECLSCGMLEKAGGSVSFRHELARVAVEDAIPHDRGRSLHRRVFEALSAQEGSVDPSRLAYHAEHAHQPSLVLDLAPKAAERSALLGAHQEAAAQYGRALRFSAGLPLERRASLLERHAFECYVTSHLGDAVVSRRQALLHYRALADGVKQGDQLRWLSRLAWLQGNTAEAESQGRAAVALLEKFPPGRELAMSYSNLAQLGMVTWDLEAALSFGMRAIRVARVLGDTETYVHALTNVGTAEFLCGIDGGRTKLDQAIELALPLGMQEHVARAYFNLGSVAVQRRDFELADHYLRLGDTYCDEHGLFGPGLYVLAWRARAELDHGRWARAEELVESILPQTHLLPPVRIPALVVAGLSRARRGEPGADRYLDEAKTLACGLNQPQHRAAVASAKAETAWLDGAQGDPEIGEMEAAYRKLPNGNDWALGELAVWLRRLGVQVDTPDHAARPYSLELTGEWWRAARLWHEHGCPYEAALALAAGDEPALRESLARLQDMGARPAARLVARRLRERGARRVPRGPRSGTVRNPASLTARELEVLTLMANGLRNTDIAARLFVTSKTVDHHMSAILRKLDARSRSEAAAKALRLGVIQGQ